MKRKDDCSEVKGSEDGPSGLNPLRTRRQNENPQRQETQKMFQENAKSTTLPMIDPLV